jgi:DNA-binding transcriptional regulator YdaS (Cro superfamily)
MLLLNLRNKEMVQNTIEKIEEKIRANSSLTEKNKTELLDLLAILKPEITEFSKAQTEHAESIAGFIERSTHEVMRREKNPDLMKIAVNGLSASVKGFETSHPQLVENVNYIANALANMGI